MHLGNVIIGTGTSARDTDDGHSDEEVERLRKRHGRHGRWTYGIRSGQNNFGYLLLLYFANNFGFPCILTEVKTEITVDWFIMREKHYWLAEKILLKRKENKNYIDAFPHHLTLNCNCCSHCGLASRGTSRTLCVPSSRYVAMACGQSQSNPPISSLRAKVIPPHLFTQSSQYVHT